MIKPKFFAKIQSFLLLFLVIFLTFVSSVAIAKAEERVFLDISLKFLDKYELSSQPAEYNNLGGLSGITYDRKKDLYYIISDERGQLSPPHFYTAKIDLNQSNLNQIKIAKFEVKAITFLKNKQGETYPPNTVDGESIAISPRNTLFISSEGLTQKKVPPFIGEFDFNGNLKNQIPLPTYYLPNQNDQPINQGVRDNLGFEALAVKANGTVPEDPFRLFVGVEAALKQDIDSENPQTQLNSRLLHYVMNPFGKPNLISEKIYTLEKPSLGVVYNGLTDLTALKQEGYLLSLERTFGLRGAGAKIFQIVLNNATDISNQETIKNTNNYIPIKKKLLLNLNELGIKIDNLEGMTLGPKLKDGTQSLILISDNNFSKDQKTQILLLKLIEKNKPN